VQAQWDAGFLVSIGGDTLYGKPEASETFAADELDNAAAVARPSMLRRRSMRNRPKRPDEGRHALVGDVVIGELRRDLLEHAFQVGDAFP
jgi:hypothetical protein